MDAPATAPWNPDRRWADPLIALLGLLALLASLSALRARDRASARPSERATLQGRLVETALAGPRLLAPGARRPGMGEAGRVKEPWDRALVALLKAELDPSEGDPRPWIEASMPPGRAGDAFRRACLAAHGQGPAPSADERRDLHRRLGAGYGADLLEARLLDREGGNGAALRARARSALVVRLVGVAGLGLAFTAATLAGIGVGLYLLLRLGRTAPPPLPAWGLSGRAAALVMLGWFLGFFVSSQAAAILVFPFPRLRWLAVPLAYGLHAVFGAWLLGRAEGLAPGALWHRVAPGKAGRDLAWAPGFLALAVALVVAAGVLSGLVFQPETSPQRDLQDLLRGASGWPAGLALFLTVAVLAPCFEELLFRGFLLPVLARRGSLALALGASSLLFGLIHLQPAGLPILGTLGLALGFAMAHTGSLRTPILVHACWNGSLFLLMRAFA